MTVGSGKGSVPELRAVKAARTHGEQGPYICERGQARGHAPLRQHTPLCV